MSDSQSILFRRHLTNISARCLLRARKYRIYAVFLFIEITLPSGASVRKDVWVQVPPSALKKLDFSGFFLLSTCQQPMSHMTRVTLGTLERVPENVLKTA